MRPRRSNIKIQRTVALVCDVVRMQPPAADLGVQRIGKSEQKCPVKETASVGISRPYSQFRAKPANDGRNTIWQLVG
jgi:hypothetical protein